MKQIRPLWLLRRTCHSLRVERYLGKMGSGQLPIFSWQVGAQLSRSSVAAMSVSRTGQARYRESAASRSFVKGISDVIYQLIRDLTYAVIAAWTHAIPVNSVRLRLEDGFAFESDVFWVCLLLHASYT